MIAAYAVALQMLLTAAVASQAVAASPGTNPFLICYGAGNTGTDSPDGQTPLHKTHCVLCTIAASDTAVLPQIEATPTYAGAGAAPKPRIEFGFFPVAPPNPRLSQGPPQIA